jgi:hypothetical protein
VDDAFFVRCLERLGDLLRDGQRLGHRQRAACQAVGERLTVDQFQNEKLRAVRLVQAVDGADVRMIERSEDLRFTAEASDAVGISGETRGQEFQRDVAIQLRVARAVHLAHAACAEGREDLVGAEASAGNKGHQVSDELVLTCRQCSMLKSSFLEKSGPVQHHGEGLRRRLGRVNRHRHQEQVAIRRRCKGNGVWESLEQHLRLSGLEHWICDHWNCYD